MRSNSEAFFITTTMSLPIFVVSENGEGGAGTP
jgi:hypothetical protein